MADLLIRKVDEETKARIARRAAENGRSVQGELLDILHKAVGLEAGGWASMLREKADRVGGMEFELPKRHTPRFTAIKLEDQP